MSIIIFIIASVLKWALTPFMYLYGVIRSITKGQLGKYHFLLAIGKDQYGNALGKYFFNDFWLKKGGYTFGNPDETISSVLGKNKKDGKLTLFGSLIADFLDKIDYKHTEKAIENDEFSEIKRKK